MPAVDSTCHLTVAILNPLRRVQILCDTAAVQNAELLPLYLRSESAVLSPILKTCKTTASSVLPP